MMIPITDPIVLAAKQRQLAEARAAYHNLVIGQSARVIVDQNGERVEFTAANKQALAAYITELAIAVGECSGGALRAARPASFIF